MDSSGGRPLWRRRRQGNSEVCRANVTGKLRRQRKPVSATLCAALTARSLFVPPTTLAVVDLGSNSFRLQIGRVEGDQIYQLATWRETLRLGAALDAKGRLKPAAMLTA